MKSILIRRVLTYHAFVILMTILVTMGAYGNQGLGQNPISNPSQCVRTVTPSEKINSAKPISTTLQTGIGKSYEVLAKSGAFINQDAWYLPPSCSGGTCVSVSASNVILSAIEAFQPGRISSLWKPSLYRLHTKVLREFMKQIKLVHGVDGREGLFIEQLVPIFSTVIRNVFDIDLNARVYFTENDSISFQSLELGEKTLAMLSMDTSRGKDLSSHAVVLLDTKPNREADARIEIVISDPHEPSTPVTLPLTESNWRLKVPRYKFSRSAGGVKAVVQSDDLRFMTRFTAITFGETIEKGEWTWDRINSTLDFTANRKYRVTLKSGLVYRDLLLLSEDSASGASQPRYRVPSIGFYHRYILQGRLPLSEIADIELENN